MRLTLYIALIIILAVGKYKLFLLYIMLLNSKNKFDIFINLVVENFKLTTDSDTTNTEIHIKSY